MLKIFYRRMYLLLSVAYLLCATCAYADNTTYILASKQQNLLKNLDRIADMVANANTTGFKVEDDIFTKYNKRTSNNEKLSFQVIGETVRNQGQGGIEATGRQLDIAINGKGFFMVNTPFGQMYTRNGSFMVNKDGVLVNQDGYTVAGPGGGEVALTEQDIEISIKEDGIVTANGEERGQIGVFMFDKESDLKRVGKGLYKTSQLAKLADDYVIAQGMLESSNVNSVTAMTDMVAISRGIENVQKVTSANADMQSNMIRKMSQQ